MIEHPNNDRQSFLIVCPPSKQNSGYTAALNGADLHFVHSLKDARHVLGSLGNKKLRAWGGIFVDSAVNTPQEGEASKKDELLGFVWRAEALRQVNDFLNETKTEYGDDCPPICMVLGNRIMPEVAHKVRERALERQSRHSLLVDEGSRKIKANHSALGVQQMRPDCPEWVPLSEFIVQTAKRSCDRANVDRLTGWIEKLDMDLMCSGQKRLP